MFLLRAIKFIPKFAMGTEVFRRVWEQQGVLEVIDSLPEKKRVVHGDTEYVLVEVLDAGS